MKKSLLSLFLAVVMVLAAVLTLASCQPGDNTSAGDNSQTSEVAKSYTYNDYMSGSPATWNVHEWETNSDSYIMGFCEMGLYDFILNDSLDGYEIIPEMAAEMPVDITADLTADQRTLYGIPEDATEGYAFTIKLNEAACWEDGTAINADTYIYSMQQMLSSSMKNYRASSYYEGTLTIANAAGYYNNDAVGDPIYATVADAGYASMADVPEGTVLLVDMWNFWGLKGCVDAEDNECPQWVAITDDTMYRDTAVEDETAAEAWVSSKYLYDNYFAAGKAYEGIAPDYVGLQTGTYAETPWENVGLVKTGDYEIAIYLSKAISDFYLKYNLSGNWIVKEDLYEANKFTEGNLTKTKYGTSAETYASYGPYKLTAYQTDKQITIEKNDKWYGWTDGKHEGQFQTTAINCVIIEEQATALQTFLQGKLDNVSLDATDMATYRSSDFILYTPESYTSKLSFNGDIDALKARETAGKNKSILAYKDFRKAISLSIDRTEFCAQCTATHSAGYGILNYMYVYDPETGALYRDSDEAKAALCAYYGVENEDQITGYDVTAAAALFQSAYDACLADGNISATDVVELEFSVYKSDDGYVKIVNFINDAVAAATAGTDLEGRVTIVLKADENYYENCQAGETDMIISTWGGAGMDPYSVAECYCVNSKHFEYGFDAETETLTINVNGEEITKTYNEWYIALCDDEYAAADYSTRLQILAGIEGGILEQCYTTPIYYRTSASLESRKVVNATEEYVQIVAFGGIRFMTYNYDDEAWAAYCAENNNQLTY